MCCVTSSLSSPSLFASLSLLLSVWRACLTEGLIEPGAQSIQHRKRYASAVPTAALHH
jgi:hypothetical protein